MLEKFCSERGLDIALVSQHAKYTRDPKEVSNFLGWYKGWPFRDCGAILFYANGQPWQAKPDYPVKAEGWRSPAKYITSFFAQDGETVGLVDGMAAAQSKAVVITEGPGKLYALEQCGYRTIALAGVENWHEKGESKLWDTLRFLLGRKDRITLCFDRDILTKHAVRRALDKIASAIDGGEIYVAIPTCKGIDDTLAKHGVEEVRSVIANAVPYSKFAGEITEFNANCRLQAYNTAIEQSKFVLDSSQAGTGKSFDTGRWVHPYQYARTVLVSNNHRNPTCASIESRYRDVPCRHKGLHQTEELLDSGNFKVLRPTKARPANTMPNCHLADVFTEYAEKGYSRESICGGCEYRALCHAEEGYGYGYKYRKAYALAGEYIRCAPGSLPPDEEWYKDTLLILDEVGQLFQPEVKTIKLQTVLDVQAKMQRSPLYMKIHHVFNVVISACVNSDKWGTPVEFSRDGLSPEAFNLEIDDEMLPNILPILIASGSVRCYRDKIVITTMQNNLVKACHAATTVIAQDATVRKEDIALVLGIFPHDIVEVRQTLVPTPNLKVYQLYADGALQRRDQNLVDSVIGQMKEKFNGQLVVFDHMKAPNHKDGYYFSDSTRGGNQFQHEKFFLQIGAPRPNLGAIQDAYKAIGGHHSGLRLYYKHRVDAEQIQAVGRARAVRRSDEITYVILSNHQLPEELNAKEVDLHELANL